MVILVQLELWDTGERALNKFDHILPACLDSTDGTLLFFSYEDRYCVRKTLASYVDMLIVMVQSLAP